MIKSLNIERFKGFEANGPKVKDLTSGVNVIYGENGSGKTTICKAIKATLWPNLFKDITSKVSAVWKDSNGDEVFSSLKEASVIWQGKKFNDASDDANQNENKINIPQEFSSCFVVSTDFFDISRDETDKSIYDLISKEISGGINFKDIKKSSELEFSPRKLKSLKKELNATIQKRKEVESEISVLKGEEASLPLIRKQINEKKDLERKIALLNNLIRKNEILSIISQHELDIAKLNKGALTMKEDDVSNFEKWEKKIQTITNSIAIKEKELNDFCLERDLLAKGKILSKEDIEDFELIKSELEKNENALEKVRQEEKVIKQKKEEYIEMLSGQDVYYKIKSYDKHRIEKLEQFLIDYKSLNETKAGLIQALDVLAENSEEAVNKQKQDYKNIDALNKMNFKALIAKIVLALSIIFVILSFTKFDNFHTTSIVLCVLSFVATFFLHSLVVKKRDAFDNKTYAINLRSLKEVKELTQKLKEKRDASLLNKINKDQPFIIKQKISEIEEEISKLMASNSAYYKSGLEGILKNNSIIAIWTGIKKNEEALQTQKEESKNIIEKKNALLNKVRKYFEVGNFESDIVFINRRLAKERERYESFNMLLTKIGYVEKEIQDAKSQKEEYKQDINEILERIYLTQDSKNNIYLIKEDRKSYVEFKDEIKSLNLELKSIDAKISNNEGFASLDRKNLEIKKIEIQEQFDMLEGIEKKEVEILTKIDAFNKNNAYLSARREENVKKDAISRFIDSSLISLSAGSILNFVESEYKKEKEPQILVEANRLFSNFTSGKYSLKFQEDGEWNFLAFNEEEQKIYNISELSLGTKAQLILALRCSYVLSFSKDKNLPILIDEVLATTDDIRFNAVMDSFFKLANDGYQIIYFTSQKSVVAQIKDLASKRKVKVNLQSISNSNEDFSKIEYQDIEIKKIPELKNIKLKERLRALEVKPISFPLKSESVHIAYLEDDANTLYKLLKLGITSFGQLNNLYEKVENKDLVIAKDKMDKIRLKANALDLYSDLWSIGRGVKFSEDILNSNTTDTFKTRLFEIANDVNWMSMVFINEISPENGNHKLQRFNQQFNKLKEVFEKESLIDDRNILPKEKLNIEFISKFCNNHPHSDKNEMMKWMEYVINNVAA